MTDTLREQITKVVSETISRARNIRNRAPSERQDHAEMIREEVVADLLALLPSPPDGWVAVEKVIAHLTKCAAWDALMAETSEPRSPEQGYYEGSQSGTEYAIDQLRAMLAATPDAASAPAGEGE